MNGRRGDRSTPAETYSVQIVGLETMVRELTKQLVEEYADLIYRVSYTYLGSKADVEDICQEVFIKLIRRQETFESSDHERNWIIRVAINACKDLLRSRASHVMVDLDDAPELSTPHDNVEQESSFELPDAVLPYVMKLPVTYREVIYLYYYEEQNIREIAHVLGCSQAAVSIRLSRARKKLRPMLEEVRNA